MKRNTNGLADLGLLALRTTVGGLMMGHGAQKLFGSFGGYGIQGTAGFMESLGLKPGREWALLAGGSEFGSGMLTALGLLNPLGPVGMWGPMLMAWAKVHTGKPIWVSEGGAELPLVNLAAVTAIALTGPGNYSLDAALKIRVPAPVVAIAVAGVVAGVALGVLAEPDGGDDGGDDQAGGEPDGDGSLELDGFVSEEDMIGQTDLELTG